MTFSQSVRKTQNKGKSRKTKTDRRNNGVGLFTDNNTEDDFFNEDKNRKSSKDKNESNGNVIKFPHKQWQAPSNFKTLTSNHVYLQSVIRRSPIVIVNGPAGSLKTFLSLQGGLDLIKEGFYDNYLYVRQNIFRPREQAKGSLPGGESEKFGPLLDPIRDNLNALVPPGELDYLLGKGRISGSDIASIRGRSPLRTVIHVDECQNCDIQAIKATMTRKTECSKLILTGDFRGQKDILDDLAFNAFEEVCKEFKNRQGFAFVELTEDDILRDDLIIDIVEGFENIEERLRAKR